jgi:hypothetical protein
VVVSAPANADAAAAWAGALATVLAVVAALGIALFTNWGADRRDRRHWQKRAIGAAGVGVGALDLLSTIQKDLRTAPGGPHPRDWSVNLRATIKSLSAVTTLGHDDVAVVEGLAATAAWVEAIQEVYHDPAQCLLRLDGTEQARNEQRETFRTVMTELWSALGLKPPRGSPDLTR